jgi:hypothetical protein
MTEASCAVLGGGDTYMVTIIINKYNVKYNKSIPGSETTFLMFRWVQRSTSHG